LLIEHVNGGLCVIIKTVKELVAETDETSGNELNAIIQQANDLCHSYASGCADLLSLTHENLAYLFRTAVSIYRHKVCHVGDSIASSIFGEAVVATEVGICECTGKRKEVCSTRAN